MAKAVLTHRFDSIYDDRPENYYHFPERYLPAVQRALGDWIVYYEPRRGNGRQSYFAVARVLGIVQDPSKADHYYAKISDYLEFPNPVPFRTGDTFFESALRKPDGTASKGNFGWAVRQIPDTEFDEILKMGITMEAVAADHGQFASTLAGFADEQVEFERPIIEQITRRHFRDATFARQVKRVYDNRCAITGLRLINGGGRPEVQAAHIRPVSDNGPDTVRNGLALSGTVHWMFDRGLMTIDEDHTILIAEDRVPSDTIARLIIPDRKLLVPGDPHFIPHPAYLKYHRETVFKG